LPQRQEGIQTVATLLVANAGGHLQELYELLPRMCGIDDERTWVTFDGPHARSLLAGEEVVYGYYPRPRDVVGTLRNAALATRLLRRRHYETAISTGSILAVSFLPIAKMRGASCHYIESATRISGPSLTARVLRPLPGIHLYTQHSAWSRPPWLYRGSVLDGFIASVRAAPRELSVVVSVGSSESYGFRALLERMIRILPSTAKILWQTGSTDVTGLPIEAVPSLPSDRLVKAMTQADVVVGHAGVGTSIVALRAGKWPILVPRRHARGEHIDDHQAEVAGELSRRGLALWREVDELLLEDIVHAAAMCVTRRADPPKFELAND
jgi:UDP-N-acetylglucosamine--N-acetylmuramyl-(pentapeptide) pyrophosphoryl-undecaprenol N-acetylglucosamine transferase